MHQPEDTQERCSRLDRRRQRIRLSRDKPAEAIEIDLGKVIVKRYHTYAGFEETAVIEAMLVAAEAAATRMTTTAAVAVAVTVVVQRQW